MLLFSIETSWANGHISVVRQNSLDFVQNIQPIIFQCSAHRRFHCIFIILNISLLLTVQSSVRNLEREIRKCFHYRNFLDYYGTLIVIIDILVHFLHSLSNIKFQFVNLHIFFYYLNRIPSQEKGS